MVCKRRFYKIKLGSLDFDIYLTECLETIEINLNTLLFSMTYTSLWETLLVHIKGVDMTIMLRSNNAINIFMEFVKQVMESGELVVELAEEGC